VAASAVTSAKVYMRLAAGDGNSLRVEFSTFLGTVTGLSTLAADGDLVVLTQASAGTAGPPYTLTRIGRGYPALCGRTLSAGVLVPSSDVCAP
jgi:hypothetical protein